MPIANAYNPTPRRVDDILKRRQADYDLGREQGLIQETPQVTPENPRFFGIEMTPDSEDKSFLRKVGEDAAMLAYAIPTGVAMAVTHPIDFLKAAPGAVVQSVRDAVDPEYYKAHPLLGIVNLAGFVQPIAGVAKSAALKTATRTALNVAAREAMNLGVEETILKTALKESILKTAVREAAKTGKTEIVGEVVRNLLTKGGVADDAALKIATQVSDNLYTTFSRQTTKMKVLESLTHPVGSSYRYVSGKVDPVRSALFGDAAKTAVGALYGAEKVAKNPEGFLAIERWAERQVAERGIENTLINRQRIMQEWVEQNSQWASLTPEERISHFKNYAEQDLTRLRLHEQTGMDIVTTKALPQSYVDAMVQTIKDAPKELLVNGAKRAVTVEDLMNILEDNFGNDFAIHSAEVTKAVSKASGKNATEALISAVQKLGNARSLVSFARYSKELQELARSIEKSGYRIGYAPKDKPLSFAADIFEGGRAKGVTKVVDTDALAKRTRFGQWVDKLGLSPSGVVEGAVEFAYRENFTQRVLTQLANKYGNVVRVGKVSIPAEKLFEWIDKNKALLAQSRKKLTLPIRTVFDVKADDLVRAGFTPEIAASIESISRESLRNIPVSMTGFGDAVINYMRTVDKGFGRWMSDWYDKYLKAAYKGRYDWSPFFSAQQWMETRLNSALLLKDVKQLPGVGAGLGAGAAGAALGGAVGGGVGALVGGAVGVSFGRPITKLGTWTAEKLAERLNVTMPYLRKIVAEPPIEEVAMVREDVLGTLQKTMLDYTSTPDIVGIQSAAKGGFSSLKEQAAFEQSIRSRNLWYAVSGQSAVRMATTFNKAIAEKFGMSLGDALAFSYENGVKKYKNPQVVSMMREMTQAAYHYEVGFLTSPLMKTLNIVWFPLRFQAKTMQLASRWLGSLSPTSRMIVMNNWVNFANWAGTDEGIEWRRTNRNVLYNILAYTTAYEQIGQSVEAVTKGRLFGGNAGLIGGVPFGFVVNLARELAILPEDPDQFDPKTGERFTKSTPRNLVSAATLANSIEQLLISISPSTPFYSLTGGVIGGVSPRKWIESLVRQTVGAAKEAAEGRDPSKGRQQLERDFKRVPLDYTRLAE